MTRNSDIYLELFKYLNNHNDLRLAQDTARIWGNGVAQTYGWVDLAKQSDRVIVDDLCAGGAGWEEMFVPASNQDRQDIHLTRRQDNTLCINSAELFEMIDDAIDVRKV